MRVPTLPQNANPTPIIMIWLKVLGRTARHPKDATKCGLTREREGV